MRQEQLKPNMENNNQKGRITLFKKTTLRIKKYFFFNFLDFANVFFYFAFAELLFILLNKT